MVMERAKGGSLEGKLPWEGLRLRKALSEEGPFQREGLQEGGGRRQSMHLARRGFLAKCSRDPQRSRRQRQREQRRKDRGGRGEGKTTGKGQLWKLMTEKMYLGDRRSGKQKSRNAREMGTIF